MPDSSTLQRNTLELAGLISCVILCCNAAVGMPGLLGGFIAGLAAFGQLPGVTAHGKAQLGYQILALVCTVVIAAGSGALVAAFTTGRLGINQYKQLKNKQAGGEYNGDQFDNAAAIDGLALFEDATFWTEVEVETPYSGGAHADLTNYSRRNGSNHIKNSSQQAGQSYQYSSQHGGAGVPRQDVSAGGAGQTAAPHAAAGKDVGLYGQTAV